MADEKQIEGPVTINIGNVCDGAMLEMFDLKLAEILANIYDMSTPATAKRSLTLTLDLKPREDRIQIDAELTCSTRLAPINSKTSRLWVGSDGEGALYALTGDPRQMHIFSPPKPIEQPKPIEFKSAKN